MRNPIDWSKGRPASGDLDANQLHALFDALEAYVETLGWRDVYHGEAGDILQAMWDCGWDKDWLRQQASGFWHPKEAVPRKGDGQTSANEVTG